MSTVIYEPTITAYINQLDIAQCNYGFDANNHYHNDDINVRFIPGNF